MKVKFGPESESESGKPKVDSSCKGKHMVDTVTDFFDQVDHEIEKLCCIIVLNSP